MSEIERRLKRLEEQALKQQASQSERPRAPILEFASRDGKVFEPPKHWKVKLGDGSMAELLPSEAIELRKEGKYPSYLTSAALAKWRAERAAEPSG